MKWTDDHHKLLLREILLYEPWTQKYKSEERSKIWGLIADTLNAYENIEFRVTNRSVREKYQSLEKNFKKRDSNEKAASGIAPDEPSEMDISLRDIIERFREAELLSMNENDEKNKKAATDAKKGEEMRLRAAETFASTKKRLARENGEVEQAKKHTDKQVMKPLIF